MRGFLDTIHGLHDDKAAANARFMGKINEAYDAAAKELQLPKGIIKLNFQKERTERKIEEKVGKMNAREAEALERCGQAYGDTPMGEWCTRLSKLASEARADSETPVMDRA